MKQAETIRFSPYGAGVDKVTMIRVWLCLDIDQADEISHPLLYFLEVTVISKELRINEEIRCKEVRLVDDAGEQLGVMPPREAMKIAAEKNLDLVEVAPNAVPPVCRIMNYGKFKYEQSKKEREAKKNQKVINIKEVKLRPNIEENDFQTKARNAVKFLQAGDKVKVTIMFRGREITHPELGKSLCDRLAQDVKDFAKVEKEAKVEGRNMIMILSPIKPE